MFRPIRTIAFVSLSLVLTSACGGGNSDARVIEAKEPNTQLGVGDVFEVRVYGDEELSSSYRVAEDGSIDFPFIGSVTVIGLEPPQISELLATKLKDGQYLRDPQVSVFVTDYASKRVSVMGAVEKPGAFPMTTGLTVIQAIGLAGGFSPLASRNSVVITRKSKDGRRKIPVKAEDISEGEAPDIPLQAGDIIYVPERVF